MYASEDGHMYLEGDTSQGERLEISLGSLHRTQNKTFFTGTDVVLPVAVEWTHTGGKTGEITWSLQVHLQNKKTRIIMTDDLIQLQWLKATVDNQELLQSIFHRKFSRSILTSKIAPTQTIIQVLVLAC